MFFLINLILFFLPIFIFEFQKQPPPSVVFSWGSLSHRKKSQNAKMQNWKTEIENCIYSRTHKSVKNEGDIQAT